MINAWSQKTQFTTDTSRPSEHLAKRILICVNPNNQPTERPSIREAIMISWAIRGLLIVAGFLVSWFDAKDALVFTVAIAFWPESLSHLLNRPK